MTDNQPYLLMQKATYHEFDAYVCTQSRSRFFYSCMWASHSIVNRAPQTSRKIDTPIKFCAQAIKTRQFPTESTKRVPLPGDGQTAYITETVRGELIIGDNGFASCNGEDVRYHGRILKQTVVLQETHFTINKVKIRCNFESGALMIVETGTTISENVANPNRFIIDSGTYVLPKIVIPCAYQIIKSLMGTPTPTLADGGIVITSETNQVHIHTHGTLNLPGQVSTPEHLPRDWTPGHCGVRTSDWTQLSGGEVLSNRPVEDQYSEYGHAESGVGSF